PGQGAGTEDVSASEWGGRDTRGPRPGLPGGPMTATLPPRKVTCLTHLSPYVIASAHDRPVAETACSSLISGRYPQYWGRVHNAAQVSRSNPFSDSADVAVC